jgi:hypothetical protein
MSVIIKFPKTCNAWRQGYCKFSEDECYFCHQVFICYSFFYTGKCKFGEKCQHSHEHRKRQTFSDLKHTIEVLRVEVSEKENFIQSQKSEISHLSSLVNQLSEDLGKPNIPTTPNRLDFEEHKVLLDDHSIPTSSVSEACQEEFPSETHPVVVLASASLDVKNIFCPISRHQNFQKVAVGQTKVIKQFADYKWYK